MPLNVCVNEMAQFGPLAAFIKGCITFHSGGRKKVSPQEEMADPQGMNMFAVARHGLSKDLIYFRTLR